MAVQATSQQITEFALVLKRTDAAKMALRKILQPGKAEPATRPNGVEISLADALENASTESKKFVEGFSEKQKNGLKDAIKRMEKADASLDEERKTTAVTLAAMAPGSTDISARAQSLDHALSDFSDEELALGKEMGIVLATGADQTFRLPAVRKTVTAGGQTMSVALSGEMSQVSADGGQRTFKLEMIADLTDLQQNITEVLRSQIERRGECGERLAVRRAIFTPSQPLGVLNLQLHYERWSCVRLAGQSSASELAESDGAVEMKVTPAVDDSGALKLLSTFSRIDASGMMGESLRSGSLGENLQDKVSQAVLFVVKQGVNLKTEMPPVLQNLAIIRNARFEDAGSGVLGLSFLGEVQISDEQAKALADQLNQTLSAQGTTVVQ